MLPKYNPGIGIRKLTQYIIFSLAGPTLFLTVLLTGLVWLSYSLRFIELIVNQGLPLSQFIYLTMLLLPSLLGIVLPASTFIAVIYCYNRLISESELIIMESSGLSNFALAKPAIIFAGFIVMIGYIISLYLLPYSYGQFKHMQSIIKDKYVALLLQPGVFSSPIDGLTVYIDKHSDNGSVSGIFVHDSRDKANPITMVAREGRLKKNASGPSFELINGSRQEMDRKHSIMSMLYFDSYNLNLNLISGTESIREREPQERFLGELFSVDNGMKQGDIRKMIAEGHHRICWPLQALCLTLIAAALMTSGEFNRRGMISRIVITSIAGIVVIAADIGILNLTYNNDRLYPLMYITTGLFIAIPLFMLFKGSLLRIRRPHALREQPA